MDTQKIAVVVVMLVFGLLVLWRVRPAMSFGGGRPPSSLKEIKKRIEAAKDPVARAAALCDAGDLSARAPGRTTSAVGYYLRAMRTSPNSAELVARAAVGLGRRPHALEGLLWRRLGAESWTGPGRDAALVALGHLVDLYQGPLRNRSRGRALANALAAVQGPTPVRSPA